MTFRVKKILVPITLSENCMRAKQFAIEVARQFEAEIDLLHVVESPSYEVYQQKGIMENVPLYEMAGGTMPASNQKFIIRDVMKETSKELDRLAAENGGEVKTNTVIKHGHSVEEIIHAIEETKPDLVVMATHRRKRLRHLLLGSVVERVVRLSPVPVLTYQLDS